MKILKDAQRWEENAEMIEQFRYVFAVITNGISKVEAFGERMISKKLLSASREQADFSIDELFLAETCMCLKLKKENHGLDRIEQMVYETVKPFSEKYGDRINEANVKLEIMTARLSDRPYTSIINQKPINTATVNRALKNVDNKNSRG